MPILRANAGDVTTVITDSKIKRKMRNCGAHIVTIVSEIKEKLYRVTFIKLLDDCYSVFYPYIRSEQRGFACHYWIRTCSSNC